MRDAFLPFSLPGIDEEDIQGVVDVLRSGWITTGPKSQAFEKAFADYVGARHACALTSATAGLHVVLMAMKLRPGDEVITSSMTWVSTVNMIELMGARPVFADIDRSTLMVDAARIAPLINEKTRMIIPIHYAGAPADLDPMRKLAAARKLILLEDAAHAAGTEYKGEKIGKTGTSIFSFHPIKNITTGEGGMVCTEDEELIKKVRQYKFHGLAKDAWDRYSRRGSVHMEVTEPGFKYNMTDMQASLGLTQLKKLDAFNQRRAELASLYDELFQGVAEIRPLGRPAYPHKHTHHLYIVTLDTDKSGFSRDRYIELLKERNIGTGIHFKAAHTHAYYQETGRYPLGSLPNTEWVSDRLFSLPLFPKMTEKDIREVVDIAKDILAHESRN
ncbi:MAG: aminotransferase class I/II-fold pyridoxal phosphate-dependent enzyme [Lentisphaerota bacterium]